MKSVEQAPSPDLNALEPEGTRANRLNTTRRDVLAIGVGSAAGLAFPIDYAFSQEAAGDTANGSEQENGRSYLLNEIRRANNNEGQNGEGRREVTEIEDMLGSEYRAPMCVFQNLTTNQLVATRTADRPPERGDVAVGAFFSDRPNQKMTSTGETPLESVVRRAAAKLPEGVTVSFGVDIEAPKDKRAGTLAAGRPGVTPVFVMIMKEVSRNKGGWSETVGVGAKNGFFLSVSGNSEGQNWSVGVFSSAGRVAVMDALSVSDLIHGTLTLESGLLFSAPLGAVEVGIETRPVEIAHDIFVNVLGPLSDYRNFVDPLSTMFIDPNAPGPPGWY